MAQEITVKSRPLPKDEIVFLLNEIEKNKIITSKATNATNNKLKDDAWQCIANSLSALKGEIRRPQQLRLKWENLKKAARKRTALIRQNNIKTGGGKLYIPPDETLDSVASMLGATCSGYSVEFGGDGTFEIPCTSIQANEEFAIQQNDVQPLLELPQMEEMVVVANIDEVRCNGGSDANIQPKQCYMNTPKTSSNKKRKLVEQLQIAQREKELAMAAYFRAKTEKLEFEKIKLKLEIEQLKKNSI